MKKHSLLFILFIITSKISFSQEEKLQRQSVKNLSEVSVSGIKYSYKIDSSITVSKMNLKDIENPQVYNTISEDLLKDQVVTNLKSALKNATGLKYLRSMGARAGILEMYTMRGFTINTRLLNGLPAISGNIDPINIEKIEVVKGPSGTLFGGNQISYGGLINIITKKPYEKFGGELGYVVGNFGLNRYTADINTPINNKVFLRINTAYQNEKSFQDAGFIKSFYLAPSIKIIENEKLTFLVNTEFKTFETPSMLMLYLHKNGLSVNANTKLSNIDLFANNYEKSYSNNNVINTFPGYSMQSQALYKISNKWTSQTVLSTSITGFKGYYNRIEGTFLLDSFYNRNIIKRIEEINTIDIQQNFIGEYNIGKITNKIVAGIDYLYTQSEYNATKSITFSKVSLFQKTDDANLTTQAIESKFVNVPYLYSLAETKTYSVYFSNVTNIFSNLSVMFSLRLDNFNGKPTAAHSEIKSQTTLSPKIGIVYQPIKDKISIFANYMNGFRNMHTNVVYDINNQNPYVKVFDPERANQWELGLKTNIYKDKILFTVSYYDILVTNKKMKDPLNPNNTIQDGEVYSKGAEFSFITNPIEGLNIIAGYSYNDSKLTKTNIKSEYYGLRPEDAGSQNLVNFWANYKITKGKLGGLGCGFGFNYASENKTFNRIIGSFILPSYIIYNASLSYNFSNVRFNLMIENITNDKYYAGSGSVVMQKLRSVSFGVAYKF